MEEKNKCNDLKGILYEIQKTIEMYNQLNPEEKIVITKQEMKDVSNLFVCSYNGWHVGLFEKDDWHISRVGCYDAGSIFFEVDSSYIGIYQAHGHNYNDTWYHAGGRVCLNGRYYISNCTMQDSMSFDDMRLIMYNAGEIASYERGKATSQEIIEVLNYAKNYYKLKRADVKKKTL